MVAALLTLWAAAVLFAQPDSFTAVVRLEHHQTYDIRGIQFYELHMPGESVALSLDADTKLAQYLARHRTLRLTLEPPPSPADLQR